MSRLIGIIGPGRAGTGLGLALATAGYIVRLYGRKKHSVPDPLTLTVADEPPAWLGQAGVVVLAVPDDAIRAVAEVLARHAAIQAEQVVLHLSGAHGQEALGPLVSSRAALGSLHPLQTIADPRTAPERLRGAWAAVEGMPGAIRAGEELARAVGMHPFRVSAQMKPVYHAGAVFASNYVVVVEAVAQRLLRHTGLSDKEAWEALKPLVRGTFENLMAREPRDVLTGPVDRGDEATIARHLASLTEDDARLYRELGRAALELAVKRGMDRGTAEGVSRALGSKTETV
ncbi:MAG TPA: Rossmann-like and DUF2520 domain-containing protein [Gemmatimonadales bacterium]|nr:Rossmann-like and DUF2520 domain-containing protein [Gemmatimonadales bacterium]